MRKVLYFLGQLTDEDSEWLIGVGKKVTFKRGDEVIREGEASMWIYIVLSGRLSVLPGILKGREVLRLGSGEIVGEMSFVDARPPAATVRAFEDTALLAIRRTDLAEQFESDTAFGMRFYKALALYLSLQVRRSNRLMSLGDSVDIEKIDTELANEMDELDATVLDSVHLAGQRFDRMLKSFLST